MDREKDKAGDAHYDKLFPAISGVEEKPSDKPRGAEALLAEERRLAVLQDWFTFWNMLLIAGGQEREGAEALAKILNRLRQNASGEIRDTRTVELLDEVNQNLSQTILAELNRAVLRGCKTDEKTVLPEPHPILYMPVS